jgi:hypothetical protein
MLYLLDANILINAHQRYYGVDMVPPFWEWIYYHAQRGNIKIPSEIMRELIDGPDDPTKDLLFGWLKTGDHQKTLTLSDALPIDAVQTVLRGGYSDTLTDIQVDGLGQDPFLIAHCLVDPQQRCVVTGEYSKPTLAPQNRRIPDACNLLTVKWCDEFRFLRNLGFKVNWRDDIPEEYRI